MNPERILVRLPNWTGDVVMATPALRALRAGFPKAHIAAHVREELAPLLEGLPHCDAIRPLRSWRRGALAQRREGRELARERFDLGVCFPDSLSSALLMRFAGIQHVVGYRRGVRAPLLQHAVAPRPEWGERREVARERYLLHLVGELGCPSRGAELELVVPARDVEHVARLLGPLAGQSLAVLAPGAGNGSAKRWPAGAFALAAEGLAERGHAVVLCGAPGERELVASVAARARCPVLDLTGRLDLGGLKALLARAALLVCNDAGARHVAVALGTPAVVLFGPTSLGRTDCNLEAVSPLSADVACRPCRLRECPIDHRCMRRIPAQRVIEAAGALAAPVRAPAS